MTYAWTTRKLFHVPTLNITWNHRDTLDSSVVLLPDESEAIQEHRVKRSSKDHQRDRSQKPHKLEHFI